MVEGCKVGMRTSFILTRVHTEYCVNHVQFLTEMYVPNYSVAIYMWSCFIVVCKVVTALGKPGNLRVSWTIHGTVLFTVKKQILLTIKLHILRNHQ